VAVHASLGRWNVGEGSVFNRSVTIAAVNAYAADMMLMAERNGLFTRYASLSYIAGTIYCGHNSRKRSEDENGAKNTQL